LYLKIISISQFILCYAHWTGSLLALNACESLVAIFTGQVRWL